MGREAIKGSPDGAGIIGGTTDEAPTHEPNAPRAYGRRSWAPSAIPNRTGVGEHERMRVWAELPGQGPAVMLREAVESDVPGIVGLLAADQLGVTRDGISSYTELQPYLHAFAAIDVDPAHLLLLVVARGSQLLATMQLSFLPGLARRGALRAQIEAVRVRSDQRSNGLGGEMSPGRSRNPAGAAARWCS